MSTQSAHEFLNMAHASLGLQDEIARLVGNGGSGYAALAELGLSHGFAFSAIDAMTALNESAELSEAELDSVIGAGGVLPVRRRTTPPVY